MKAILAAILFATSPVAGFSDELPGHFDGSYLCVNDAQPTDMAAPRGVLEMLDYINRAIATSKKLTIRGDVATFEHDTEAIFFDAPDFEVVSHNDLVVMERAFILDGGSGCNLFADSARKLPSTCSEWSLLPLTGANQSSQQTRLVVERMLFRGGTLTQETVFSGDTEPRANTFTCEDFDTVARYFKQ